MQLHDIVPIKRFKKAKRLGRGPGSGHGKTSTRGHKGAKARSGRLFYIGFEGGNLPFLRKIPKRGFNRRKNYVFQIVNVQDIDKRFKQNDKVNVQDLFSANLIKNKETYVKILGKGTVNKKLTVCAHKFSAKAKDKIEKAGGSIEVLKVDKSLKYKFLNKPE